MAMRWGLGPVFYYEWLLTSRRWQIYAARALFLVILLAALFFVWCSHVIEHPHPTLQEEAAVGEHFFYALIGTQLVLVLLAAPAATAGSVCLDRARGTLAHLLVTDLSDAEIILGKLAARLLPVLALVACTLPVMALNILLGGIEPLALAGAFLITVGVALLGCSLGLTLSVWGHKTHEVLLFNYVLWGMVLLAYPMCAYVAWEFGVRSKPPAWLAAANPFWLAFAPYAEPGTTNLADCALFLAVCAALALLLAGVAAARVRAVTIRQTSRPARPHPRLRARPSAGSLLAQFGPSLDGNPVLWREWHRRRPSRWVRFVWVSYAVAAALCSGVTILLAITAHAYYSGPVELPLFVNGFQVSIGLLFLSVSAATSLAEERAHGSLDLLLVTPLTTSCILWGKWWGACRPVLLLTILPALVACALALRTGRLPQAALLVALILAYGAAITSMGLAVATWTARLGRAVAASVVAYVLVTVAWPFAVIALWGNDQIVGPGLVSASPFFGAALLTGEIGEDGFSAIAGWDVLLTAVYLIAALVLMAVTHAGFDRRLGRISG
jgi:ABC-type transport system involved in multi-copper enzyme maturation permease subunit